MSDQPSEQRGEWVSRRATAWVYDEAPCPAELVSVLGAIARRCDEHGRGSRQRSAVIAEKVGKSLKQTRRDISRLRDLGLIKEGDQTLVEHIPEYERPKVYDVNLDLKGPKPAKGSKNPSGSKREEDGTPSLPREGSPSKGGGPIHGATQSPSKGTPSAHPREGGVPIHGDQKSPLNMPVNNSLEHPSLSARDAAADASASAVVEPTPERDTKGKSKKKPSIRDILATDPRCTDNEPVQDIVTAYANSLGDSRPKGRPYFEAVYNNGDLTSLVDAALDSYVPPCRLEGHSDPVNDCEPCKAMWFAGTDPYAGQEDLRPPGWIEVYGPMGKPNRWSAAATICPRHPNHTGVDCPECARKHTFESDGNDRYPTCRVCRLPERNPRHVKHAVSAA